ncbi:MAG TPA: hypothetical protein VF898_07910 [Chloroflexota bacterium]
MKISERTGQWVEMDISKNGDGEIVIKSPNGIWAGWSTPIYLKQEEVAAFLRSHGWKVEIPQSSATHGK